MLCEDCGQTDQLVWSGVVALQLGVPTAAGRLCFLCAHVVSTVNRIERILALRDDGCITSSEEKREMTFLLAELELLLSSYDKKVS